MITVVTFDLWNTLLSDMNADETRVGYLLQTLTDHGVSRDHEAVRAAYDAAHAHAHRISVDEEYRHVSCWERLAFILQRLRVDLPRAVQQSIVTNWEETILEAPPPLVQDAVPVLTALNPDYRLGIISDTGITPGRVLRRVLEAAQVLRFFRTTVFSDETGYNKPHRRMFETALAALEGTPSEALHIGDLLETDVAGAHCMGITTMWLNRGGPRPTRQYEPDFEVSSLPDLLDVLTAIQ